MRARRPALSVALVGFVVVLTGATGLMIGGLGWRQERATSRALVETAMAQAAQHTAAHAARFLTDAEAAARLGPRLVAEGGLDPGDLVSVERFALAVLRANPDLSWVSYGDRADRFVGAWRDAAGQVYVNRSFPRDGRIRLEEDRLLPDGHRRPVRRSDDHGYRPTERPYFRLANAGRDVSWTEPYEFYAGGGLGITCAAALLDADGQVRGVFTVDFSLDRLGKFLETIEVSPRGRVVLATTGGSLLIAQPRDAGRRMGSLVDDSLLRGVIGQARPDLETGFEIEHRSRRYLGRAAPLTVGNLKWRVYALVPARDYTERVDAEARRTLLLGVVALLLAGAAGILVARWLAAPLRELAGQARRIRTGDLEVTLVSKSRDEIGVLARAVVDMAQALRDRDFIRETLGRYVSSEVAEQCLQNRDTLRLGGELREVAILMSDLRGFSELSEQLGPEAMIGVLNRHLASMTPVILDHGGTINDFVGDGILVVFGAPFARPDDTARAVRCAAAMQRAMAALNQEQRALGLPELAMGIGVHAGPVVAGNIGSPDRIKYGVIGSVVNLVSRIQSLAAGGEVLVTDAVVARLPDGFRLSPGRPMRLKGAARPVALHRLLDGDDGGEPTPRPALRVASSRPA